MGSGRLTRGYEARDQIGHRRRLAFVTLRDRLQEHLFGLRIDLERFVTLQCKDSDRCILREFYIEFDPTVDDLSGSNSHMAIVTSVCSFRGRLIRKTRCSTST
jgi:hypothetical protein